jgi:CDP-paratose 2-epimerase
VRGRAYNVGGGPGNQLSLLELLRDLERRSGRPLQLGYAPTRPGDQPVFVADIRRAERDLGWSPKTSTALGTSVLFDWVSSNLALFGA